MNDTPRTDAEAFDPPSHAEGWLNYHPLGCDVDAAFARTLERELTAAKLEIERLDVAGIHTCHAECSRYACALKRERDALANAIRSFVTDFERSDGEEIQHLVDALFESLAALKL
jgi:hypothetical protein